MIVIATVTLLLDGDQKEGIWIFVNEGGSYWFSMIIDYYDLGFHFVGGNIMVVEMMRLMRMIMVETGFLQLSHEFTFVFFHL